MVVSVTGSMNHQANPAYHVQEPPDTELVTPEALAPVQVIAHDVCGVGGRFVECDIMDFENSIKLQQQNHINNNFRVYPE